MGDPSPPCVCIAASWADEASCVCLRDRDSQSLSPVQLVQVPRTPADADGWAAGGHRGGRAQAGRGGAPAASSGSLPLVVAVVFAAGAVLGGAVTHLPAVRRVIHTALGARHSHRGRAPAAEAPRAGAPSAVEQIRPAPPPVAAPPEAAAPAAETESTQTTPRVAHGGPRLSLTTGSSPLDEATAHRIFGDADRVVALKRAAERSAREQAAMGTQSTTRPRRGSSSAAAAAATAGEGANQGGATPAQPPPHLQSATWPAGGDAWRPWEPDAWDAVDLTGVAFTPVRKAAAPGAADAMMATPYTQRKGER